VPEAKAKAFLLDLHMVYVIENASTISSWKMQENCHRFQVVMMERE
jgi:hypothetical protein